MLDSQSSEVIRPGPYVGRAEELRALSGLFERATQGATAVALISGEAGVGKTRLVEEFLIGVDPAQVDVVWGRCWEGEGAPAFWPWIQCFRALAEGTGRDRLVALAGGSLAHLAQILPDIAHAGDDLVLEPDESRFRALAAASELLAALATQRPLVVVLDDLHWADLPSVILLRFVVQQVTRARLLILSTVRDVELEAESPLARELATIGRQRGVVPFPLRGLDESQIAQLASLTGVEPESVTDLRNETAGNPFFVTEVLRMLSGDPVAAQTRIPASVREVVLKRVSLLPAKSREILPIASVVGRDFSLGLLAGVSGLPRERVLEALDAAIQAQLLTPAGGEEFRFAHWLTKEALYMQLPPSQRARVHRSIAETLAFLHAGKLPGRAAEIADHLLQAGPMADPSMLVRFSRMAGEVAMGAAGYEAAASWFGHAVAGLGPDSEDNACDRFALLIAQADAFDAGGNLGPALDCYRAAIAIAREREWGAQFARAVAHYAEAIRRLMGAPGTGLPGGGPALMELCAEAASSLGPTQLSLRAELYSHIARTASWLYGPSAGLPLAQSAIEIASEAGDWGLQAKALMALRRALEGPDHFHERYVVTEQLIEHASRGADATFEVWTRCGRLADWIQRGDLSGAEREMAAVQEIAEASRRPGLRAYAGGQRATWAAYQGRFEESEGEAVSAATHTLKDRSEYAALAAQIAHIRVQQGRAAEVEAAVRHAVDAAPNLANARSVLATVLGALDKDEEARATLHWLAADGFAPITRDMYWLVIMVGLSDIAAFSAPELSAAFFEQLRPYSGMVAVDDSWTVLCYGAVDRALGVLSFAMGDLDAAQTFLRQAIALDGSMGGEPWVALASFYLAGTLAAAGAVDAARKAWSTARGIAERLGMNGLVSRCDVFGRDHGLARSGPAGLSRRELDVIRLLAGGRSNKEIAQELVLSVRTIELHIANIYQKTGSRGRADATAFAVRNGLAES